MKCGLGRMCAFMNKCILLLAYLRMLGIGGLEKFGEFNRSVVQHCLWPYFYGSVCALAVEMLGMHAQ
jgi:hypothetical protein